PHRTNFAAAAAGTSCLLFCGAGFMPADGAATHAKAAAPPALAGINPAPQVLTPPGQSATAAAGTSCFFLWGRLYAGRRSRGSRRGVVPNLAFPAAIKKAARRLPFSCDHFSNQ